MAILRFSGASEIESIPALPHPMLQQVFFQTWNLMQALGQALGLAQILAIKTVFLCYLKETALTHRATSCYEA